MTVTRNIFYISDRTGLTAENIGEALLNQFSNIEFKRATYPFIDTPEKARSVVDIVNRAAESQGRRPIAFVSVVNNEIRQIIKEANAFQINFFDTFLGELEKELDVEATTAHHGHHGSRRLPRHCHPRLRRCEPSPSPPTHRGPRTPAPATAPGRAVPRW